MRLACALVNDHPRERTAQTHEALILLHRSVTERHSSSRVHPEEIFEEL